MLFPRDDWYLQTRWTWSHWQVFLGSPSLSVHYWNQQVSKCVLVSPGSKTSSFPDSHWTSDTFTLIWMNWELDRSLVDRWIGKRTTDNNGDGKPLASCITGQRWRPRSLTAPHLHPNLWTGPASSKPHQDNFTPKLRDYQPPCLCSN